MLLNRLREERGFTMVVVMLVLLVGGLLVMAAFAASDGDTSIARHDQYYKQAYSAAEAGINFYYYELNADVNYWTKCPAATTAVPVNKVSTSSSSQVWRSLPSNPSESYSIEVLPASGSTLPACTGTAPNQQISGVLNNTTGTFKVRSTGQYRGVKRSIVATFKRKGFLDFLWFTNYETDDPLTYPPSQQTAAANKCVMYYRDGRANQVVDTSTNPDTDCQDPDFITGDNYQGPMHTNDEFSVCGNPTFGRFAADSIEMSASGSGWHDTCGGSSPTFNGTKTTSAPVLTMPPTNTSLKTVAQTGGLLLTGTQHIVLSGNTMTINGGASQSLPGNGVIYVQNGTCTTLGYDSTENYTHDAGCGDAWVSSTSDVTTDVTIAADNDIIVDGNLTHDNTTEIGLIANNFVRLYHPVWDNNGTCTNATTVAHEPAADPNHPAMSNPTVDAAILSLTHSWIVDNWACGAPLGTLNVTGAIAQNFRGPVGTHRNGVVQTGYLKNYVYDDDLRFRDPPFFLDPIQASWRILGENEQVAAH
jgi:Tfp pilus assembly protein PilX